MDVRRIVEIIVEEMAAAGVAPRQHACSCHGFLYDCCPDRVRGVLDAGASRLGLHASGARPGDVAALIDHTLLKPDASRRDIETLCREAADFGFATVCINPCWVREAAKAYAEKMDAEKMDTAKNVTDDPHGINKNN